MSTYDTLADRLNQATTQAETASQIMHDVANGDDATEVQTDSGPVPSIAKWFAELNNATSGAVAQVEQAIADEAQLRQQAVSAEANARQQADALNAEALEQHAQAEDPHTQYLTLARAHATALLF